MLLGKRVFPRKYHVIPCTVPSYHLNDLKLNVWTIITIISHMIQTELACIYHLALMIGNLYNSCLSRKINTVCPPIIAENDCAVEYINTL